MSTGQTALAGLLATMSKGQEFPALSHSIVQINQTVDDENSRADALTEIILRDVSLTKKLLRLVNAAHFGSFGGQPVSTVSRAVVILGFDAVRDAAVSLLLFEHLENHAQAEALKTEVVESFFCGVLGRLLAASAGVKDYEEAFISALFRNLGRLMARFHFYPETQRVKELMVEKELSEETASRRVLGVDYDQLGLGIAKFWRFPSSILAAMTPLDAGTVRSPGSQNDRLRAISNLARELYRTYAADLPAAEHGKAIAALAARFTQAVSLDRNDLIATAYKAAEKVRDESAIIKVDINQSPLLKRLIREAGAKGSKREQDALALAEGAPEDQAGLGEDPTQVLVQGMQDLTRLLLGPYQIGDVFKMVAELYYRAGCFDRVLVATLDKPSGCLLGRVAHGPSSGNLKTLLRVPLAFTPDVFHAAISKGQDILISDAGADNIRGRIPDWYLKAGSTKSLLLLPILLDNKPLALLYGDRRSKPLQLAPEVLGLLKALRNQATLAIRHQS
jgi:HD-like signal output (HDOD) protein